MCFSLESACHKSPGGKKSCTRQFASSRFSPNAWRIAACRTGSHCSRSRSDSHPAGTLSSHQISLLTGGKDVVEFIWARWNWQYERNTLASRSSEYVFKARFNIIVGLIWISWRPKSESNKRRVDVAQFSNRNNAVVYIFLKFCLDDSGMWFIFFYSFLWDMMKAQTHYTQLKNISDQSVWVQIRKKSDCPSSYIVCLMTNLWWN